MGIHEQVSPGGINGIDRVLCGFHNNPVILINNPQGFFNLFSPGSFCRDYGNGKNPFQGLVPNRAQSPDKPAAPAAARARAEPEPAAEAQAGSIGATGMDASAAGCRWCEG